MMCARASRSSAPPAPLVETQPSNGSDARWLVAWRDGPLGIVRGRPGPLQSSGSHPFWYRETLTEVHGSNSNARYGGDASFSTSSWSSRVLGEPSPADRTVLVGPILGGICPTECSDYVEKLAIETHATTCTSGSLFWHPPWWFLRTLRNSGTSAEPTLSQNDAAFPHPQPLGPTQCDHSTECFDYVRQLDFYLELKRRPMQRPVRGGINQVDVEQRSGHLAIVAVLGLYRQGGSTRWRLLAVGAAAFVLLSAIGLGTALLPRGRTWTLTLYVVGKYPAVSLHPVKTAATGSGEDIATTEVSEGSGSSRRVATAAIYATTEPTGASKSTSVPKRTIAPRQVTADIDETTQTTEVTRAEVLSRSSPPTDPYPLLCTVSNRFNDESKVPPDGLCDMLFYDSLYRDDRNPAGGPYDEGAERFLALPKRMNTTRIGVSFDVEDRRFLNLRESWPRVFVPGFRKGIDDLLRRGVSDFGILNIYKKYDLHRVLIPTYLSVLQRIYARVRTKKWKQNSTTYMVVGFRFNDSARTYPKIHQIIELIEKWRWFKPSLYVAVSHISFDDWKKKPCHIVPPTVFTFPENVTRRNILYALALMDVMDHLRWTVDNNITIPMAISFTLRARLYKPENLERGPEAYNVYQKCQNHKGVIDVCRAKEAYADIPFGIAAYDVEYDVAENGCPAQNIRAGDFVRLKTLKMLRDFMRNNFTDAGLLNECLSLTYRS
ncbi:hypothetical protein HPB50_017958 [Hyalomma asiaticum]|uniref:Uncharacterized protein n=1 Tax=Hyalomma asiaticum TaxID=266040 RepID=A0ACB7T6S0_HYAAI|nr:hypothetical protein HPB50_017958 [Hyalomma asiaticum]